MRVSLATTAFLFLMCLALGVASAAQRSRTLENVGPRPHYAPSGTSDEQLAAAIRSAAEEEGWLITAAAPGVMEALLLIRSHRAEVTIRYDESNFSITYADSWNLNYNPKDLRKRGSRWDKSRIVTKGPRIHPNYNVWVSELADRISVRLGAPPELKRTDSRVVSDGGQQPGGPGQDGGSLFVADEIDKLDELRQRGVLTRDEFERLKQRLLSPD